MTRDTLRRMRICIQKLRGVYVAGDVRVKSLRQVVTAVADGAIAAVQVERRYVRLFKKNKENNIRNIDCYAFGRRR